MLGSSLIAPLAPLLGLTGLLATPATLISEFRTNKGPITWLTRKGTSHNVVGILPAHGEVKSRIVLLTHYDSVRVRNFMKPNEGKSPRRLVMRLLGLSYLAAIGSSALGFVARRRKNKMLARTTQTISGAAGAAMLTLTTPLLMGQMIRGIDGEGANDNASGVAVLLSLAEQMVQTPLEHTEIWFVATGGEEIGLVGARALANKHGKALKDAYFFAVDTVGTGRIHYTVQENFLGRADISHDVVDILVAASERGPHGAMPYMLRAGGTDAGAMLAKHFKAASISCLIKDGKFPEINWPTDTRKYIEPETPAKVTAFMKDVLYEIDHRMWYNKGHKSNVSASK
ncbi:MAG: hypothetical protein NVS9B9_11840 [Ktedonobacteraceae bacterium]